MSDTNAAEKKLDFASYTPEQLHEFIADAKAKLQEKEKEAQLKKFADLDSALNALPVATEFKKVDQLEGVWKNAYENYLAKLNKVFGVKSRGGKVITASTASSALNPEQKKAQRIKADELITKIITELAAPEKSGGQKKKVSPTDVKGRYNSERGDLPEFSHGKFADAVLKFEDPKAHEIKRQKAAAAAKKK